VKEKARYREKNKGIMKKRDKTIERKEKGKNL
jgi:hypothetical protein